MSPAWLLTLPSLTTPFTLIALISCVCPGALRALQALEQADLVGQATASVADSPIGCRDLAAQIRPMQLSCHAPKATDTVGLGNARHRVKSREVALST